MKKIIGLGGILAIVLTIILATYPFMSVQATPKYLSINISQNKQLPKVYTPPTTTQIDSRHFEMNLSGDKVKIGSANSEFTPVIRFDRFTVNGTAESFVELNLVGGGSIARFNKATLANGTVTTENKYLKLEYKAVEQKAGFNEFGGVDYKITVKQPTGLNTITFTYNHQACNAYLQPPLTQAEIDAGATRPDYAVNSIAFYHDTKGGAVTQAQVDIGLTTGKIGHLYRMQVTDANNNQTWADWGFGGGQSQITLTIPQAFLDSAVYPLVIAPVGDTFGYTTAGLSVWSATANYMFSSYDTYTGAVGDGTSMSIYGAYRDVSGVKVQCAVYDNATAPANLITNAVTDQITINSTTPQWWTGNFSSAPSFSDLAYRLFYNNDGGGGGTWRMNYDSTAGGSDYYKDQAFGTMPATATLGQGWLGTAVNSIYVTYEPAASFDITETTTSKAFGTVAVNTTYWAIGHEPDNPINDDHCTFILTNAGDACDLDIKMADFTGGVGWNIEETANPGADEVMIYAFYSGQDPSAGLIVKNADQEFYDGLAVSAHIHWELKMVTGTSFTDGTAKTGILTITARAEN